MSATNYARRMALLDKLSQGLRFSEIAKEWGISRERVNQIAFPDKAYARERIRKLLKRGKITRPDSCQECGSPSRIEAHHADYSKPTEVKWLCRACHIEADRTRNTFPRFVNLRDTGITTRAESRTGEGAHL